MGYDRGDSFPLDFEPNEYSFSSKSKGKLSPRSYPIQFEGKWNTGFLSAHTRLGKNVPRLSEKLAPLCIIETLLNPSVQYYCGIRHNSAVMSESIQGGPQLGPHDAKTRKFP